MRTPFLAAICAVLSSAAEIPILTSDSIRAATAERATVTAGPSAGTATIRFSAADEPATVRFSVPAEARDFARAASFRFDFRSDSTVAFRLALRNRKGQAFGYRIGPWENVPARVAISRDFLTREYMNNRSGPAFMISNWGNHIDLTDVAEIELAMRPNRETTLLFGPVVLSDQSEESRILAEGPLVDEFGQWIPAVWPGKFKSLDELRKAWSAEQAVFASAKPPQGFTRYGGLKPGSAPAKGFFHAKKIEGRWWLIDPEGALFFSIGIDCVRPSAATPVRGREKLFAWLPPASEERSVQMADFYLANVKRRFGDDDWEKPWKEMQDARLRAWGINTIGNWSAPLVIDDARLPYVTSLQILWTGKSWVGYPDTFSEEYEGAAARQAAFQTKPRLKDPYLIGYFIGNEPRWHDRNLIDRILADPQDSATQTFVRQFLQGAGDSPETREKLLEELVRRYNRVHHDAIKQADPNHMVLGFRYAGRPPDAVLRANDMFDVFSINIYQVAPPRELFDRIVKLLDKPILIGEFHFGVPGRGMAPSLVMVKDYAERGVALQHYFEQAAAHWAVVGAHWFQMADQPVTGRFDGENYNLGFVTQQDVPYPEMVKAAQQLPTRLYEIHSGGLMPPTRAPLMRTDQTAPGEQKTEPAPKPAAAPKPKPRR